MNIGILGAGAYGLALADILVRNKKKVVMWTYSEEEKKLLSTELKSDKLEGYKIPKEIELTTDLKYAIEGKDIIVIAVPAFAVNNISNDMSKYLKANQTVLIATKGIEQDTCLFLADVFIKHNKKHKHYAVISGPTFAKEIIKNIPIGFSLATHSKKSEKIIRDSFENDKTKFRATKDVIGVEICGSIKNVMAIASGILEGMGVTDSTRALFLTETLNDIKELIDKLGGDKKTILSFAGFGDILMTCTSKTSRNFSLGYLIGSGASFKKIEEYKNSTTIEGLYTLNSIHQLIGKRRIKIPIINLIYDIIFKEESKEKLLEFLITKEYKRK